MDSILISRKNFWLWSNCLLWLVRRSFPRDFPATSSLCVWVYVSMSVYFLRNSMAGYSNITRAFITGDSWSLFSFRNRLYSSTLVFIIFFSFLSLAEKYWEFSRDVFIAFQKFYSTSLLWVSILDLTCESSSILTTCNGSVKPLL